MNETVRVLVVDEDSDVRDLTKTFLEREDEAFAVETVASATEALARVEDEQIDAVVSDYRMPGMDGIQLSAEFEARDAGLPFVLFSAVGDSEMAAAADAEGIDGVVQKGTGSDTYAKIAVAIRDALES